MRAERIDVTLVHLGSAVREFHREVTERPFARRQRRLAVVVRCVLCDLVCGALGTEVVCMRNRSVVAALRGRRHRRQKLTLAAREPRLTEHYRLVELHRRPQHRRAEAHRLEDVEDLPRALDGSVVLLLQEAVGLVLADQAEIRARQFWPYRVCGKPRSTRLVAGSGQRLVTAFVRV